MLSSFYRIRIAYGHPLFFPALIMMTAWGQGKKAAVWMIAGSLVDLFLVWLAGTCGWLPAPFETSSAGTAVIYGGVCMFSGIIAISMARELQSKLRHIRQQNTFLEATELERARLEGQWRDSEVRHKTILDWTTQPMLVHRDRRVVYINPAAVEMFGAKTVDDFVGIQVLDLIHPECHSHAIQRELVLNSHVARNPKTNLRLLRRDGGVIYAEAQSTRINFDQQTSFLVCMRDITQEKESLEHIERLAYYDVLTGLPNRRLMIKHLKQTLSQQIPARVHSALAMIDLDNFKMINDTLGHRLGDELVVTAAHRLTSLVPGDTFVARTGGDEFMIVLNDITEHTADNIEETIIRVLDGLRDPYILKSPLTGGDDNLQKVSCTASIGVVRFNGENRSVGNLLKQVDMAAHCAKMAGRNVIRFFDPGMQRRIMQRAEAEVDLRTAIDRRQFVLHYQPQVNAIGEVTGAEALIRWEHPIKGTIAPGEFIPIAEETGLILPIGYWVMEEACHKLAEWALNEQMSKLALAVNVSARQFNEPGFVGAVHDILKATNANPKKLKIELTESTLVHQIGQVIEKMHALKAMGIILSLDDFGTGFSSLSYLKQMPLDQLKIDQKFVHDVMHSCKDAAIVKTIAALGSNLGMDVIAEGVETQEQMDMLLSLNCCAYQGYLFSRPLSESRFENLVASQAE